MLHLNKYIIKKRDIQHIFIMGDNLKLFFKILAISTIAISIYLNDNNIIVVKEVDTLLKKIIDYASKFDQNKIDSEIINDSILIGQNGKTVNIKKSYINMKQLGYYDEKFIIYDENNIDIKKYIKYKIEGYKTSNKEISIIILLNENDKQFDIENLSYFVDGYWYEKNKVIVDGITGYNFDYEYKNIAWLAYNFRKNNKISFCLNYDCSKYGLYNISKDINYNNFFNKIKNDLKPGEIFVFDNNESLKDEIKLIVNYVKNQDYEIKKIENILNRY